MFSTILYYVVFILLSLSGLIIIFFNYKFSYWKSRGMPYFPPKFPYGNVNSKITKYTGNVIVDLYKKFKQNGYQYGGIYVFASSVFLITSPELAKLVLLKNFLQFQDHGVYIDLKKDKMAANLLTYSGNEWKQMRAKLTPALSPGRVKLMFPLLIEACQGFDEILTEVSRKAESIDIWDFAGRFFTDTIGSCAFGIKCNCMKNPDAEFRRYGKLAVGQTFSGLLRLRLAIDLPIISRIFDINMFPPESTSFFRKVVLETLNFRQQNNIHRADLLDNLITSRKKDENDSDGITDDQIAAASFLYYIAGFETSSTTSAYCMTELARNVDIQDKVRKEVLQVLKEDGGVLTYEGINKMKYMDKVISETLRKYPVVYMMDRMCTEPFKIPETNITIEKGTRTLVPILGIQMDPEYFPDPEKFDPERFTEEEISKRTPYTYIPFGEGPRICPGMKFGIVQVKVFVATMLKNYRYTLHPSLQWPLKTFSVGNLTHPEDLLALNVEKL